MSGKEEKSALDYRALAPKYEGMFKNIYKMQWEIGKSLYEDRIVSDGQRQALSSAMGGEPGPKTLKTYYEVYVNFHERWPQGRPEHISHGVLEQLNRIADEEVRDEFLKKYPKPTKTQAEAFVNQRMGHGIRNPRGRDTTSVTMGGVIFRISYDAEGSGEIKIVGASKVGEAKAALQDGSWVIEYLP